MPDDWSLGAPLRVGDKVVFTGFVERARQRVRLEERSRQLGVRILGTVSGRTAMVVTDSSFVGGKLERAHELRTRIVNTEGYTTLLKLLQPALIATPKATQVTPKAMTTASAQTRTPESTIASPGEIRAWGIANGYAVGVRGRLSAEMRDAYERSTFSQASP